MINTLRGHRDRVRAVAFGAGSSQGLLASAGGDQAVKLWDLNGALIATLNGHTDGIIAIPACVECISVRTGYRLQVVVNAKENRYNELDFSPDGQFIVSASDDRRLILWDLNQVLNFDRVLAYGCQRIQDYLRTNIELEVRDRHLCDEIGQ